MWETARVQLEYINRSVVRCQGGRNKQVTFNCHDRGELNEASWANAFRSKSFYDAPARSSLARRAHALSSLRLRSPSKSSVTSRVRKLNTHK